MEEEKARKENDMQQNAKTAKEDQDTQQGCFTYVFLFIFHRSMLKSPVIYDLFDMYHPFSDRVEFPLHNSPSS